MAVFKCLVIMSALLLVGQCQDEVEVITPATIVIAPAQPEHTSGGRLTLTCAAYGEPLPVITWSLPSMGIMNFSVLAKQSDSIHVNTTEIDGRFVVSLLELCDVNYTSSWLAGGFVCEADNGVTEGANGLPLGRSRVMLDTLTPVAQVPAILLAEPDNTFLYEGTGLVAQCVAYGSPKPQITWSSQALQISDFEEAASDGTSTTVITQDTEIDGLIVSFSTLHICPSMLDTLTGYFVEIECSTTNGLSPPLGVQSGSFVADPFIEILGFDAIVEGATTSLMFTFGGGYDPDQHGCFLDKLIFIDNVVNTSVMFRPQFPGRCVRQSASSSMVVASLDPRDFIQALNSLLFTDARLYVATDPAKLDQFAPPLRVIPINLQNALSVTNFIPNTQPPAVESFDFDLINSQILIHFNSFVIASTFNPMMFILQGTRISQDTQQRVTHILTTSIPQGITDINVQTVCVTLSPADRQILQEAAICTSRDNCAAYFTSDLVDGHNGVSVANRPPTSSLTVSQYRSNIQVPANGLYMNVTLSYIGCEVSVTLTQEEIYVARVGEFITRIDCFADGEMGNMNPELFYDGRVISDMTLDWPLHSYYAYPRGLAVERPGRYECRSASGNNITQYLVIENPYFQIVEGESVNVRLYDDISLTFLFANNPPIDILQTEIRLVNMATSSAPSSEPIITTVNNFKASVVFNQAVLSLTGSYDVQIRFDSQTIASTTLSITVQPPLVSIVPPVVTIVPGQSEITLRCTTNSEELPITWISSNLVTELSSNPVYSIQIPSETGFPDLTSFTCIVRNPEVFQSDPSNIVGRADAYVRNVNEPITVLINGAEVIPDGHIRAVNRVDINYQCIGDSVNDNIDLQWIALPDGQTPEVITADSAGFQVQYNYNEANLTVLNSVKPFAGKLRCYSPTTGASSTLTITAMNPGKACPEGDVDSTWKIMWDFTIANSQDVQPCPRIEGIQTFGFASRVCGAGGVWEAGVDTSACSTASFNQLQELSNDLTETKDFVAVEELRTKLATVMNMLSNVTTPRVQGSHFPADLNTANLVTNDIISVLRESIVELVPIALNIELVKVFNNVVQAANTEGWRQSQTRYNGSSMLLSNIEKYGHYLAESLSSPVVDTSQYVNGIMLIEPNIEYGVRSGRNVVNFPSTSSSFYSSASITISSTALANQLAVVAVSVVVNNIQNFLPPLMENNKSAPALTPIIYSQLCRSSNCSPRTTFTGSDVATVFFTTTRTIGASNPRCVFWDDRQGKWSSEGVDTNSQVAVENREFKSYRVVCLSSHLSSFAVVADVEVTELQFYTIPIFIGSGVVIFASFFAMFALILSCLVDSIRKYFTVAFLTHISFIFSVMAAYATYLAGIELAAEQRINCIAVAGLLHYFFTAAFAWLFCESLVITLFDWVSRKPAMFILFFIIGWGLPAIPTAISLGLINDQYGTTSHCWFYFDGVFQSEIVLAFIIPILALLVMTVVFLLTGCGRTCAFMLKFIQGSVKKHTGRLLWCLILSNIIFILLLSSSWVFAMLYVNVYALDSVLLGWLFMGCSTGLGIYIFIFSIVILLMNQKVDYEYMHQEHTGLSYVRDPMKGSTYEMMDMPLPEGPVGRPRIIIPNPVFDDGFPSAYPRDFGDDDDTKLIDVNLDGSTPKLGESSEEEEEEEESEASYNNDGDSDEDDKVDMIDD